MANPAAADGDNLVERAQYRSDLLALEQKAQGAFDRTIVTLSGGALGVSFAFVKNFLGGLAASRPGFLFTAWVLWTASLASILTSHYTSALALRHGVARLDREGMEAARDGGFADRVTGALNLSALLTFLAGLLATGVFVLVNLGA